MGQFRVPKSAQVSRVPVYEWALPGDTTPLREAVVAITRGEVDVVLFNTSVQVAHLLRIASEINLEQALRRALTRTAIGSIGPTTSEELRENDIAADFEPSHPKMGFLVKEAAERSSEILLRKRQYAG